MPQNIASFVALENIGAVIAPVKDGSFVAYENTGAVLASSGVRSADAYENVGATLYPDSEPVVIHEYIIAARLFIGWGIPFA